MEASLGEQVSVVFPNMTKHRTGRPSSKTFEELKKNG